MMRHYPLNSPRAAGRIVALALLADGHLCRSELDALKRLDAAAQLGLEPIELQTVVHGFCEDLLSTSLLSWSVACQVDPPMLAGLLADVDDPALRRQLLSVCRAVAVADDHLADGESIVLSGMLDHWQMPSGPLEPRATPC